MGRRKEAGRALGRERREGKEPRAGSWAGKLVACARGERRKERGTAGRAAEERKEGREAEGPAGLGPKEKKGRGKRRTIAFGI
jgi:hypothetical protein